MVTRSEPPPLTIVSSPVPDDFVRAAAGGDRVGAVARVDEIPAVARRDRIGSATRDDGVEAVAGGDRPGPFAGTDIVVTRAGGEGVGARAGPDREMLEAAVDRHQPAAAAGLGDVRRRSGDRSRRQAIVDEEAVVAASAARRVGAAGHGDDIVAVIADDAVAVGGVVHVDGCGARQGHRGDAVAQVEHDPGRVRLPGDDHPAMLDRRGLVRIARLELDRIARAGIGHGGGDGRIGAVGTDGADSHELSPGGAPGNCIHPGSQTHCARKAPRRYCSINIQADEEEDTRL